MEDKGKRKSFFVNEDGTLIIPTITFVVVCLTSIIVFLGVRNKVSFSDPGPKTTQKQGSGDKSTSSTAEFNEECKGCTLSFIRQIVEVEANTEIDLNDILTYKNLSPYYVKYKAYDEELISVDSTKLKIKVLNAVGETNLTAYYQNLTTSVKIIVAQKYVSDADFNHRINYVYPNEVADLDVTLYPKGIDRRYLRLVSLNPDILSIDDSGHVVGKQTGKAIVRFDIDGVDEKEQKTTEVYVVNNKMKLLYKNESYYVEESFTEYNSKINGYVYIGVKYEDRENKGYSAEDGDLTVEHIDSGCLSVNGDITFEGVNPGTEQDEMPMYLYKVPIKFNADTFNSAGNKIEIFFKLPDGSVGQFTIERTKGLN